MKYTLHLCHTAMSGKRIRSHSLVINGGYMLFRGVLSVPWFEFGGECILDCEKSGHMAKLIFHTKVENTCVTLKSTVFRRCYSVKFLPVAI